MRQLKLPFIEMEELFRRMVFNLLARDQDDHTKNISFLMNESGTWRLSPAYDMTYAYDPKNKWMKAHQMSINGKRDEIKRSDVGELAKKMNIKKPGEIIDRVKISVSNWTEFADQAGVNTEQIKPIENTFILDF